MIYILGAGGMARETLNIYKEIGKFDDVYGFIEENCKRKNLKIHGKELMDSNIINSLGKKSIFIGAIGSPNRKYWIKKIELLNFDFDIVVHPFAVVGDTVNIERGCIICAGSVLTSDIKIGNHSIVNVNATINHDCEIGDFVTVAPGVNIGGYVTINDESWLGIGATVIDRVNIGKNSFIGAGAVVTKDIPDNVLAVGVPAKPIKKLNNDDWKWLI